tara:strand:+ start:80 stop:547 length:468 start_codon:yes stop_codon:yes gene_type:complete
MANSTSDNNSTSSSSNPDTSAVSPMPGLSFINPETGGYQPLHALVNGMTNHPIPEMRLERETATAYVRASQIALVEKFGCIGAQVKEGVDFLFTFSLSSTFNSWNNNDDGSSGISAKAKLDLATTAGARLVLIGLLESHSDAKKKGRLTIGYNNG